MKQSQREYPHFFHALFSQSKNGSQQLAFLKNEYAKRTSHKIKFHNPKFYL